jgi:hypothetical protein
MSRPRWLVPLLSVALTGCNLVISPTELPVGDGSGPEGPPASEVAEGPVDQGVVDAPHLEASVVDGCVPSCAGVACGDSDGCGGVCTSGFCPGSEVCVAGVCKDCSRWSLPLAEKLRRLAVDTDGTVYVVGSASNQIYIGHVDGCGTLLGSKQHLPAAAKSAAANSLVLQGNNIYVGGVQVAASGSDPQDGYLGSFTKQPLALSWEKALVGSTAKDEVWDLVAAGGALWLNGSKDHEGTLRTSWGHKASTTLPTVCSFDLAGAGLGRGVTAADWNVYFTGAAGGKALVAGLPESACSISPCNCSPSWTVTFQDGTYTEGRALVVVGSTAYIAGYSGVTATDLRAAVYRVDLVSKNVETSYTWNPTPDYDLFLDMVSDGNALYVVGSQGSNGITPVATVHKLSMPDLTKVWASLPGDVGSYGSVAITADGGLLLAGDNLAGAGFLRRCPTAGPCP